MPYDVMILRLPTNEVQVLVDAPSGKAKFNMGPDEARRFAFGVIEAANQIDQADKRPVDEG